MDGLLDDERLEGAHEAHISYRPARLGLPVRPGEFRTQLEQTCQIWGGAGRPLLPIGPDDRVSRLWARLLPGSAVDGIAATHTGDISRPDELRVPAQSPAAPSYGDQLAIALLPYKPESGAPRLEVVTLAHDDPWEGIYAACLGSLPLAPDEEHLRIHGYNPDLSFDDFAEVNRVEATGSLSDLLSRLDSRFAVTPRRLSMLHLSYGTTGSTSIRTRSKVFPDPGFARRDAGPNVVVICTPGDIHDLALLWNLRAANGDGFSVPIGIPASELSSSVLWKIQTDGSLAINGFAHKSIYVTSTSVPAAELASALGEQDFAEVVEPERLADLGRPAEIGRDEVLVWSEGRARLQMIPGNTVQKIFDRGTPSHLARMHVDVQVYDSPLPQATDYRTHPFNGSFYAGSRTTFVALDRASRVEEIEWPSRLLAAQSLAVARGYELKESEPGRAGRFALVGLGSVYALDLLAHAPLLGLLEEMSARQGFGWYKERLRASAVAADPLDSVGPTVDEIPRKTFNDFKKVLGRNERATRQWLMWAEKSNVVVKGFEIACPVCRAKQWIPVAAFTPPITCRGCASVIDHPFGDQTSVSFQYRLSERMRRVFESDAMGHLLLARFFRYLFHPTPGGGGNLVGMSPGMEVRARGSVDALGEADLLMLNWAGEFIPAEYKRSVSGLTGKEIAKLDLLCDTIQAPWSVAAFGAYNKDVEQDPFDLERRDESGVRTRAVLSYDLLLEPHPVWALGADPLEIRAMSLEEVSERENAFVQRLAGLGTDDGASWFEQSLLRPLEE